jgi:hypothetical protein
MSQTTRHGACGVRISNHVATLPQIVNMGIIHQPSSHPQRDSKNYTYQGQYAQDTSQINAPTTCTKDIESNFPVRSQNNERQVLVSILNAFQGYAQWH